MGGVGSGIKGHRTLGPARTSRINKARTHGYLKLLAKYRRPGTSSATKAKFRAAFAKLHRGGFGAPERTTSYRHRQAVAGVRASIRGRKRFG